MRCEHDEKLIACVGFIKVWKHVYLFFMECRVVLVGTHMHLDTQRRNHFIALTLPK